MKWRLVIVTEIIAPYRIPVFNALAAQREIDLHVIFLSETDRSLRDWDVHKEEINFPYQVLPSFRKRIGKYNILLNWGLSRNVPLETADAILCGGYNYLASWELAWRARRKRIPLLMWVESTAYDKRGKHAPVEFFKRRILKSCNAFVVPGKRSRDYLHGFDVDDTRIFCAPNAVDNEFFLRTSKPLQNNGIQVRCANLLPERYFLFAGRLVAAKGVFDLLAAYGRLSSETRSRYGLVFAGAGEAECELRERAKNISPGTVSFPGFAQRDRLATLYGLADILVFPTHTDTWGLVVNEGMACGLPVICSNAAGCVSDLVDCENGAVFSAGDVEQMAASMERLAADSVLRLRMGEASQARIAAFSPSAWSEGVMGAMRWIQGARYE